MDGWKTTFLVGRPIFRGYVSFREGKHLINSYRACQSSPGFFVFCCPQVHCILFQSFPFRFCPKISQKNLGNSGKKHHLCVVVLRMRFECCRVVCPKKNTSDTQRRHVYTGRPDAEVEFVGRVREVSRPAKGEGAEGIFTIPHAPWDGNIYPAISFPLVHVAIFHL